MNTAENLQGYFASGEPMTRMLQRASFLENYDYKAKGVDRFIKLDCMDFAEYNSDEVYKCFSRMSAKAANYIEHEAIRTHECGSLEKFYVFCHKNDLEKVEEELTQIIENTKLSPDILISLNGDYIVSSSSEICLIINQIKGNFDQLTALDICVGDEICAPIWEKQVKTKICKCRISGIYDVDGMDCIVVRPVIKESSMGPIYGKNYRMPVMLAIKKGK